MDSQTIAALTIVAAAAAFVLRRMLRAIGGRPSGCGDCAGQTHGVKIRPLLEIELPRERPATDTTTEGEARQAASQG